MPLSLNEIATVAASYGPAPNGLVLYHGTNDAKFFSNICLGQGFSSNQMFLAKYSLRGMGPTTQYGPGIYLADTRAEALNYGNLIIRFEVEPTTDYFEFYGNTAAFCRNVGTAKQNILDEGRLYALIRVTAHYYTLRTPFNVTVTPDYI